MAWHEHFKDYTAKDIEEIKREVCDKHKCPYFRANSETSGSKDGTCVNKSCNYILITGHMRGCMPDECKHYLDADVKQKRFGATDGNIYGIGRYKESKGDICYE